ncbi:reverse transcriptase domain-containing protein [Tanacetum coccineum]
MNTAVAHPQANGLVERANRSLMEGIKTRLGRERAGWVDELQTFYGHIDLQSSKVTERHLSVSPTAVRQSSRHLLQERREIAAVREKRYKTKMEQYYNKKVRLAGFRPGEFVFRRNEASRVEDMGKLGPKWEGPYRVMEAYENGSYKLQTLEDKEVPRTWQAINLRQRDEPECIAPKGMIFLINHRSKGRARVHNTERHDIPHRPQVKGMSQSA